MIEDRTTATPQTHYVCHDGNGNVIKLITQDAGGNNVISAAYTYDPFGKVRTATGPYAATNPVRFSTKFQDPETGWNYYGYRDYDAANGRWPCRDPIEENGGIYLYGMCFNNLLSKLDYLGRETWPDFFEKNLLGRDKSKDGAREDYINKNKCMGAVGALCGKMGDGKTPEQGSDEQTNVSTSSACFATLAEAESAAATMKGKCPCKDGKKGDAKVWSLAWNGDPSKYDKNGEADPANMPDDYGKRLAPSGSFDSRVVKPGTGGNRFVGGYPNDKNGADPVDETQAEWEKRNKDAGYNNTQYCVTCPGDNK